MVQRLEDPSRSWTVSRALVDEVDSYSQSVAGVQIEAVRTGAGVAPNNVLTARSDLFTLTACAVGLPMTSRTRLAEGQIVVAVVTATPRGARWCDIDLRRGSLLVYGPEAEHTAVNLPGLQFTFLATDVARLTAIADVLGAPIVVPARGEVHELPVTDTTRKLGPALSSFGCAAGGRVRSLDRRACDLLAVVVAALREDQRTVSGVGGRSIDSRHLVHACIDYADHTERIPSIAELCLVAHVSERKLREAFVREFDLPPSRFFRNWALELAHRRLRETVSEEQSVTEIAADIGFAHLGRFAGHYRLLFGETPSTTLRSTRDHVS